MSRATERLQTRAELIKLARLLGREPGELVYLEALDAAELRSLRDGVTDSLYSANLASLRKLAAASRLLPTALVVTLAQRAFGPLLSARLAGLLDLDRAVDVAGRLPPPFLAEVAVELDPRRASSLIASIAPGVIGQITEQLAQRCEYVTMGSFVGHLGDDAVTAALSTLDDAALLQVAFVLEDKDQLGRLIATLPRGRLAGLVAAAAGGLWVEALDLINHLPPPRRREFVKAAFALDDAAVSGVVAAVMENDLWGEVLRIAERDEALQARLAERLASLPAKQRRVIARDARAGGTLARLGILGEALTGA